MKVCLIERNGGKYYQVMTKNGCGFNHIFPGKLFTLENAKKICNKNKYEITAIGDEWKCL